MKTDVQDAAATPLFPTPGGQGRLHSEFATLLRHVGPVTATFSLVVDRCGSASFYRYEYETGALHANRMHAKRGSSLGPMRLSDCPCNCRVRRLQDCDWADHLADSVTPKSDVLIIPPELTDGVMIVFGLERAQPEPPFSPGDLQAVESLVPALVLASQLSVIYESLVCEKTVLSKLPQREGLVLMVLAGDPLAVIWVKGRTGAADWEHEVAPLLPHVLRIAKKLRGEVVMLVDTIEVKVDSEQSVAHQVTVAAASIEELGLERSIVVAVEQVDSPSIAATLSLRERQVAELLVDGYANVNIAALLGISENTVRTYVRRIYGKLGIVSRIDLARIMSGQEPSAIPSEPTTKVAAGELG